MKQNIGLFGGTFDPIHYGHIGIAKCFIEKCNLNKCIFIPAKVSPFKVEKQGMFSAEERFALVEKAISINPKFEVSDFEIFNKTSTASYSIDTVRFFRKKFLDANLFLLIGTDQAIKFSHWKDYLEILKIVKIVIANRPENISEEDKKKINDTISSAAIWLNNDIFPVTSTEIRENMGNKK